MANPVLNLTQARLTQLLASLAQVENELADVQSRNRRHEVSHALYDVRCDLGLAMGSLIEISREFFPFDPTPYE